MLLFIVCWSLIIHPFHVSVYSIEYEDSYQAIRISCRIFQDDLEKALRKENGNNQLNIAEDSLLTQTTSKLYFQQHLKLRVNGSLATPTYLGGEVEDDVMWVYLELENVQELESIEIENRLLTEVFDDQQNILHFKINGDKKSYILSRQNRSATYSL